MGVTTTLAQVGSDLESYSFTAEVPTMDPSEMTGSTGSLQMSSKPLVNPQLLRNRRFTLTDDKFGAITGRISDLSWTPNKSATAITSETVLQRLNTEVAVVPSYTLSMNDAMQAMLSDAGFTCTGLPTIGTVVFPGFFGTMLDYVKHFCAAYSYEYFVQSDTPEIIRFRAIRGTTFDSPLTSLSCTLNDQTLAQNVDITRYTYEIPVGAGDIEFTPHAVDSPQILTVDAGKIIEYDIQINGWVAQLNQPVVMDLVGPGARTDVGAYCVSGNDGLPITAAQWTNSGGRIIVSVKDNPSVITVQVIAPAVMSLVSTTGEDTFSPYSIAATAVDDNTMYNSLHITGKGVLYSKEVIRLPTGIVSEVTIAESGATVDNPFLASLSRAYDVGLRAAQTYAGPNYQVTGATAHAGDYNTVLGSVVSPGQGALFRVNSVTVAQDGETFTGIMDTTFGDFNTTWAGKTFGDFSTLWGTYTFLQFNLEWAGKTFAQFNTFWTGKTFEDFNAESGYQTFGAFATSPLLIDPSTES
jgi:hypothetical protein